MTIDTSLTWFGWVYILLVTFRLGAQIGLAGKPKDPPTWPTGGPLLFSVALSLLVAGLVLFVGVTH